MTYPTYGALVTKVNNDYDITDENFISPTELLGLFNEAVKDIEKEIHDLHHEDKYFLNQTTITLVPNQSDYAMPTGIYGNKLRHIWYQNGTLKYEIRKLRKLEEVRYTTTGNMYSFLLLNLPLPTGVVFRLYPTPTEAGAFVNVFFIRECQRFAGNVSDPTDVLEIPEAENVVIQHVKRSVARKMRRADLVEFENGLLSQQLDIFRASMKEMIPDENNQAIMDLSAYCSQGLELYNGWY